MSYTLEAAIKLLSDIILLYDNKLLSLVKDTKQWQKLTNERVLANAVLCTYQQHEFRLSLGGFNNIIPMLVLIHDNVREDIWLPINESLFAKIHSQQYKQLHTIINADFQITKRRNGLQEQDGSEEGMWSLALLEYAFKLDKHYNYYGCI